MRKTMLCTALGLILAGSAPVEASPCVDIALVLAVDSSGSIDDSEYAFQKSAISHAFRDEAVISVLRDAGTVAVSAVFWGDAMFPTQNVGWFVVNHGEGAESFAREIDGNRRAVFGNTDIGNGIWAVLDLLALSNLCPRRSIIDISGDGREARRSGRSPDISLYDARQRARQMGVRINALVVSDERGDLVNYYAKEVILGPGSFVMSVKSHADYAAALKKKLIRELAFEATEQAPGGNHAGAAVLERTPVHMVIGAIPSSVSTAPASAPNP